MTVVKLIQFDPIKKYLYNYDMDLIGHQEIISYLQNCFQQGTLAHAYLFLGPSGIGRMKLLELFLPQLLAAKDINHADINIVKPDNNTVTIEQIRELRRWLGLSSLSGRGKAAVIDQAEKMGLEAQNAFLKTLEEPVDNTYIFLLANHRRQLLPTIYSRVVPIYFNPVPAAKESHGCPGRLRTGLQRAEGIWRQIMSSPDKSERLRIWLKAGMKKEDMRQWLQSLVPELRKMLLAYMQEGKKPAQLVNIIRKLLESLAGPAGQNWQLIAENLIISI